MASELSRRWLCEECPYEAESSVLAEQHANETEHRVVLAHHARTHPARPNATPETTGPGSILTDGEMLLEVTDCRVREIVAGGRTLRVPERRMRSAATDLDDEEHLGGWVPMAEVVVLQVVRPVAYDDAAGRVPDAGGTR